MLPERGQQRLDAFRASVLAEVQSMLDAQSPQTAIDAYAASQAVTLSMFPQPSIRLQGDATPWTQGLTTTWLTVEEREAMLNDPESVPEDCWISDTDGTPIKHPACGGIFVDLTREAA